MGRILVVEHSGTMREWLVGMLTAAGHDVQSSAEAREALRIVADGRFDVVVASLDLPEVSGVELTRELRQVADDVAIVLVSDPMSAARAASAVKIGAYGYVQTPVDAEQLGFLVHRAIQYVQLLRENATLRDRVQGVEIMAGKPLADIEKQVILSTLEQFKGHRMRTAAALGIGVRTLGMKLKRWREEGQLIQSRS